MIATLPPCVTHSQVSEYLLTGNDLERAFCEVEERLNEAGLRMDEDYTITFGAGWTPVTFVMLTPWADAAFYGCAIQHGYRRV
jgi:hypothetical protein